MRQDLVGTGGSYFFFSLFSPLSCRRNDNFIIDFAFHDFLLLVALSYPAPPFLLFGVFLFKFFGELPFQFHLFYFCVFLFVIFG